MRTILPAFAQAVVMHASLDNSCRGSLENLKEKLQVWFQFMTLLYSVAFIGLTWQSSIEAFLCNYIVRPYVY